MKKSSNYLFYSEAIQIKILTIRVQKVLIDSDLAKLYGVGTKRLNEQVKRNMDRFPIDFLFRLTIQEKTEVVANCDHLVNLKFAKTLPFAFTEHGAIMAAAVLNSPQAIEMSVFVVRAFVRLREILIPHKELSKKISELENKIGDHDSSINTIILAIKQLMPSPPKSTKRIGFRHEDHALK